MPRLEAQRVGLRRETLLVRDGVFGECAASDAEDGVADAKACDIRADRDDRARRIDAHVLVLRASIPRADSQQVRLTTKEMPVVRVDGTGVHLQENLSVP